MKRHELEILAPAGAPESLTAAVRCGADAVYLGGAGLLNARRGAVGFNEAQLATAVSYCHGRGAKVYLTLNTLVLEQERDLLLRALAQACAIGVDALLVQDLAVARTVRAACPQLPLHASTQMSVTGVAGALILEKMGFERVVLARELSLEEIAEIRQETAIELEVFVHGALCMSVSGQCYLSSVIGGRSGNRGLCAQPCRLPFAIGESDHALSLRDLSLLDRLDELAMAGVCAVKIEGRLKRPEYVAAAVTACVQAREGQPYDAEGLAGVFSRSGFTQGYLDGDLGSGLFGVRQREDVTAATQTLLKSYRNLYQREAQRVPVDMELTMGAGVPAMLKVLDDDGFVNSVLSDEESQEAITAPTTEEKAVAALSKTGNTPFFARDIACEIAPDIMLPASALNELRRKGLETHLFLREELAGIPYGRQEAKRAWGVKGDPTPPEQPALRVRLGRADQLQPAVESGAQMIVLPLHLWEQADQGLLAAQMERMAVELPRCTFGEDGALAEQLAAVAAMGCTQAVVGSLGAIHQGRRAGFALHGDVFLNIVNTPALEEYRQLGLASATLSFEMMLAQAKAMGGGLPRGLFAYGYLPLMALRACPARAHGSGCGNCDYPTLTDRMGKEFFLTCDGGVSTLHNCIPLWMADRQGELRGLDFVTVYLTKEGPDKAAGILKAFAKGAKPTGNHTRGLYYRKEDDSFATQRREKTQ